MRKAEQSNATYFWTGAVAVLLLFFHYLGISIPLETAVRSFFMPVSKEIYASKQSSAGIRNFFYEKAVLVSQNQELKKRVASQEAGLARLNNLELENSELRKQIGFKDKNDLKKLPAEVVGKDTTNGSQIIIINQGSKNGVEISDPVISGEGVLIGKVSKVEPDISFVRLLTDNQSRIGSAILNKAQSLGILKGGFGISLRMIYIPRNETVLVGDKVITSGLENGLPRGLTIGSVAVVENEPYAPFQQAVITPTEDLSKLLIVSVVKARD